MVDLFLVWLFSMFGVWVLVVGRGMFTWDGLIERRRRRGGGFRFLES